ncbi:MAG: hypothetical protein QW707_09225 [Candidatus Bathyarchaeia archaeon]
MTKVKREMDEEIEIPEELYKELEALAENMGITVEDAIKLSLRVFIEHLQTKREGKDAVFLYDYGEQGFVVSMHENLPERKSAKVVSIKMP